MSIIQENKVVNQFFAKDFYDDNALTITADVIDKCNYSCKYCCNKFPRTNKMLDLKQLKSFVEFVRNKQTNKNKSITASLIGGETMLHPDLLQFCKDMDNIDVSCEVYTNFSLPFEKYNEMPDNTRFIVSWHKAPNSVFLKNFDSIQQDDLDRYAFFVMYEHDNIDESIDVYNKIKSRTKAVTLKKLLNMPQYKRTYTQAQLDMLDYILDSGLQDDITAECKYRLVIGDSIIDRNDIHTNDTNPFKHWSCNAGLDIMNVDIDGDVYPCCTLKTFGNMHKRGNISCPSQVVSKPVMFCNAYVCCNYDIKKTNVLQKATLTFNT